MRNAIMLAVLLAVVLPSGCASRAWNGEIQTWGTLRGVLRDGDTAGKVSLSQVSKPDSVGIGAPEGLAGEIVVLGGDTWVSRAGPSGLAETQHPAPLDMKATFLAMATVARWAESRTHAAQSLGGLATAVRTAAEKNGVDTTAPFPFVVEGGFATIKLHVLNGRCPFARPRAADYATHKPIRVHADSTRGVLVGFYSDGPPGVLTHAGKKVHVHAVLNDEHQTVGHVEAVSVDPGAVIRVPAVR